MKRDRALAIRLATPPWSGVLHQMHILDLRLRAKLLGIITGVHHAVDHIVPLLGESVCGLNIPINMRITTRGDNASKGNKLEEDIALPEYVFCVFVEPLPSSRI